MQLRTNKVTLNFEVGFRVSLTTTLSESSILQQQENATPQTQDKERYLLAIYLYGSKEYYVSPCLWDDLAVQGRRIEAGQ